MEVGTSGRGFVEVTDQVAAFVSASKLKEGVLTLFCRHTSASLTIQENASPEVLEDLLDWLDRLAPEAPERYRHRIEGPDDMPAHLRTVLTASTLSIPVVDARPVLGTWQGIYLIEHRSAPHVRQIVLHMMGV
jgi:secondary thiamine-phosphate synthase enzyme